jgi:hypothetical protein
MTAPETMCSWVKTRKYSIHIRDTVTVLRVGCLSTMRIQIKAQVDPRFLSFGEIVFLQEGNEMDVLAKLKVPVVSLYGSQLEGLIHVGNFIKSINTLFEDNTRNSMYTNPRNFRDRLLPTVQYPLNAVPGITQTVVNEVRKSNKYRTNKEACTSIKGVSNLFLTGAYGKVIRIAYSSALRALQLSKCDAVVAILVFESDIHLIGTKNTHLSPSSMNAALSLCPLIAATIGRSDINPLDAFLKIHEDEKQGMVSKRKRDDADTDSNMKVE